MNRSYEHFYLLGLQKIYHCSGVGPVDSMSINKNICSELSDNEIIVYSRKDIKYFACLYERFENSLLRYIVKISSVSEHEAQDILQESFIKAWKNINEFDVDLKLSSWLYRIVHNETVSFCRKKKSYGKNNKLSIDENIHLSTDDEIIDGLQENEKNILTNEILEKLPQKYQEVLVLKFLEHMSYEEVSDILKIPEGTVAVRINRAKKMFKKIVEKENKIL